ncbi:MAG TPA: TonB-dependent receptor [Gemmatimonadales bacterium]|nr:TonB-dependent receptor [Gemmatimonadales bacterium]
MTLFVGSGARRLLGLALATATLLVMLVGPPPAAAQQTTGKVEGTVSDQAGVPIANAQVFIVGTSFGAVTNDKGYYFINNVPVGTYTLRAQFIGYQPTELTNARVLGGQTVGFPVKMTASAVQVGVINVTAAANPIVPRDQVTSKTIVSGSLVASLPIDDVRNVISLQPGVVESGAGAGVAIRGGRPGEANVYIDGAPVRSTNSGAQAITVGTNAVEEASVTTGAIGVEFGDAQAGIISFTSKAGGEKLAGSLSGQTDEPFGNAISLGFNRFEGSIGGPIPRIANLRFFVSGVLQGQVSPFRGSGWDQVPTYVAAGIDTSVTVSSGAASQTVVIPRFAQFGGTCDASQNFGYACQGARFPMNWNSELSLQGKLSYSYGNGSNIALSGLAHGNQFRNWPGTTIADPQTFTGAHLWDRLAVLNWSHTVYKAAEHELAINANFSWGQDRGIAGPLDPASELSTRSPAMGVELSNLNFAGFGSFPFPITDQIIRNVRTNTGLRTPLLNRTDLFNQQPYRMNPFGLQSGGWVTAGFFTGGGAALSSETRVTGRVQVDWQANRFHRFNFGAEGKHSTLAFWASSMITQIFMNAYDVHPVTYAAWAADRLDLGDVVLELGARYDYMNAKSLFANVPGRIFTNPLWSNAAATNDAAYAQSLAAVFTPSQPHHTISPRLRVSFPITESTDFRLSYAHQVQTPDFATMLSGTNNDLSFTNSNNAFGRDVTFGKTIQFEFGVRHAFNPDLVLDIAAYNKDKVSDLAFRIKPYDDPSNPGRTLNVNVLTNADFGYARGLDFKLDRRVASWLNASVAYTFQVAKNTGSDPFAYLRTSSRQISQVTGDRVPPPEQPLPVDDQRQHNIVGAVSLTVPTDWQKNTTLGKVFRDVSVFATFRAFSGLPFTRVANSGAGTVAPRVGFGLEANSLEPINSSTMPWNKVVDMRINKAVKFGRTDVTLFADLRNVFNFRNIIRLFNETSDVVNALNRQTVLSPEFANLANEAAAQPVSKLGKDGSIDIADCTSWTATAASTVDCVMLQRVEARFGNGDKSYTLAEQTKALNAYYDNYVNGVQNFYGAPRNIRLGFELSF